MGILNEMCEYEDSDNEMCDSNPDSECDGF